MATASSSVSNGITQSTGPKISSWAILALLSTSVKIVGWKKAFAVEACRAAARACCRR